MLGLRARWGEVCGRGLRAFLLVSQDSAPFRPLTSLWILDIHIHGICSWKNGLQGTIFQNCRVSRPRAGNAGTGRHRAAAEPRHDGPVRRKGPFQAAYLPGQPASLGRKGRRHSCILSKVKHVIMYRQNLHRSLAALSPCLGPVEGRGPGRQGQAQTRTEDWRRGAVIKAGTVASVTSPSAGSVSAEAPLVAARGGCP